MDKIDELRRDIIKLDGELSKVKFIQENMSVIQIKLEDGFMMLYDDCEREELRECVEDILQRRCKIWQSQIDEKMNQVRELLHD
jgi:hypothetical protein